MASNKFEMMQENFIYLSQLIKLPVLDRQSGEKLGVVADLAADIKETYPNITGLIIRINGKKEKPYISWDNVKQIIPGKALYVEGLPDSLADRPNLENHLLLCESLWDRQIVDIAGSKVVRVNDLHLLKENSHMWLVHVDIGFRGLLRRLGWQKGFENILRLAFSAELKDKLISWKYVQPITSATMSKSLQLKVEHAKLNELLPADLADILADLGVDERTIIFDSLDNQTAAKTLQELSLKIRIQVAESLMPGKLATILKEMPIDEVVDLVAKLPKKIIAALYKLLPADEVGQIKELLRHSQQVAGSLMTTEYIAITKRASAGKALEMIKTEALNIESYHYVYVIDENQTLVGIVTLRQLLVSDPTKPVSELMRTKLVKVRVNTEVEIVAQYFSKYDFDLIPVVDRHNKMQGIITMKDAFETVFTEIKETAE
jgi:magnesium transporter